MLPQFNNNYLLTLHDTIDWAQLGASSTITVSGVNPTLLGVTQAAYTANGNIHPILGGVCVRVCVCVFLSAFRSVCLSLCQSVCLPLPLARSFQVLKAALELIPFVSPSSALSLRPLRWWQRR